MKLTRLLCAMVVGGVLAFGPVWMLNFTSDSGVVGFLKDAGAFIAVPGGFVAWMAAGGRMVDLKDMNWLLADLANFIFYSGLAYLCLAVWGEHRRKARCARPIAE